MSADEVRSTIERASRWLEEWGRVAPAKRSQYWVRLGVKNGSGDFTESFGGDARPEADSIPAMFGGEGDALDRLVWFLRFTDELCLEAQTARSITGSPDVPHLVDVVRSAADRGWVVRWTDQGGQPAQLDPQIHQYRVVGIRLTDEGKRRLAEIERDHAR